MVVQFAHERTPKIGHKHSRLVLQSGNSLGAHYMWKHIAVHARQPVLLDGIMPCCGGQMTPPPQHSMLLLHSSLLIVIHGIFMRLLLILVVGAC